MSLPPFADLGLLPAGVHDATLEEVAEALCWNAHRRSLWADFLRFVDTEYRAKGLTVPLWIDGSFTRSKALPSDIDVVIDLTGPADRDSLITALELRLRYDEIKTAYHVDLWARHPLIPNDLTAFFQYVGDKGAVELNVDLKHPKGIVRTQP